MSNNGFTLILPALKFTEDNFDVSVIIPNETGKIVFYFRSENQNPTLTQNVNRIYSISAELSFGENQNDHSFQGKLSIILNGNHQKTQSDLEKHISGFINNNDRQTDDHITQALKIIREFESETKFIRLNFYESENQFSCDFMPDDDPYTIPIPNVRNYIIFPQSYQHSNIIFLVLEIFLSLNRLINPSDTRQPSHQIGQGTSGPRPTHGANNDNPNNDNRKDKTSQTSDDEFITILEKYGPFGNIEALVTRGQSLTAIQEKEKEKERIDESIQHNNVNPNNTMINTDCESDQYESEYDYVYDEEEEEEEEEKKEEESSVRKRHNPRNLLSRSLKWGLIILLRMIQYHFFN